MVISGRDGGVEIPCDDLPLPLAEADYTALHGEPPSYDMIGRGIFEALRSDPDCINAPRYAQILKEGYPHIISEIGAQILMLERKEVDLPYVDRRINHLKIFALLEPGNPRFPLEIGLTYMDRGLRLSGLQLSTASMYKAEEHLKRALQLSPDDPSVLSPLGEVSYLLGRYEAAAECWRRTAEAEKGEKRDRLLARLDRMERGVLPRVPPVDYLEAAGGAFELHRQGEWEEAAAVVNDILDDEVFCEEFPIPELYMLLGECYEGLSMPGYAQECYRQALALRPAWEEARRALDKLTGKE